MVDQTSPDAYEKGVSGAGDKWQRRVSTDEAKNNYTAGVDGEAASELTNNALESSDDYADNLAAAFGVSNVDSDVVSEWEDGLNSDAEDEWQAQTSGAADTWEDGVNDVSASDWESAASESSDDWFNNAKDAISPD